MSKSIVGVIGGSGLYRMEGLEKIREIEVKTPFGKSSDKFITGTLGESELV
jgi:5'-methylthioadenosine phosphorylase